MAWLAIIVVASVAPAKSVADYTLLQRRLLSHGNLVYKLLQQNTLKNLSEESELPLSNACHKIGSLYLDHGKMVEAKVMYPRALTGKEKAWGPDHRRTLDTRYNLALLFKSKSMFQDAAKHFELVAQGYTQRLGPDHPETVDAFDCLKFCQGDGNDTLEIDKNDSNSAASARGTCTPVVDESIL